MASFDYVSGKRGPGPHRLNDDREKALASLNALDQIDANVVLFGHGEPWTQGLTRALDRLASAPRFVVGVRSVRERPAVANLSPRRPIGRWAPLTHAKRCLARNSECPE